MLRCILVQMIQLSGVNGTQIRGTYHCLLQLVEGILMHRFSVPLQICFDYSGETSCYSLETLDKLLVKSADADKLSNFMDGGRSRPTSEDLDLLGVHAYSIFFDDVSAKANSWLKERRLIVAGKKLGLLQ